MGDFLLWVMMDDRWDGEIGDETTKRKETTTREEASSHVF